MGVSQVFALLPAYLRELGVPDADRLAVRRPVRLARFVLGLPLVPLWGVWADKYSRKAVIVRSALVEARCSRCVALSPRAVAAGAEPAADRVPARQHGRDARGDPGRRAAPPGRARSIAMFGAAGPIGFAVGPVARGRAHRRRSAGRSRSCSRCRRCSRSGRRSLVWFGSHEVRPAVVPRGATLALAFGAVRSVLGDPIVRRMFLIYGVAFLANQMCAAVHAGRSWRTSSGAGPGSPRRSAW